MLEPAQARVAVLPPDSPLIANWSNLPARITRFERNGVLAGDLRDTQRAALFDFLSAALSREGAELVQGAIAVGTGSWLGSATVQKSACRVGQAVCKGVALEQLRAEPAPVRPRASAVWRVETRNSHAVTLNSVHQRMPFDLLVRLRQLYCHLVQCKTAGVASTPGCASGCRNRRKENYPPE